MVPCRAIPIDAELIEALVGFIVRGLMFHHWGAALGGDCSVEVYSLTQRGEQTFNQHLGMNATQRVAGNVGQGALRYHGMQAVDNPNISMWEVSIFGGLKTVSGDQRIVSTKFGVTTGPVSVVERAARIVASGLVVPNLSLLI